jgi:hypothetical protein
MILAVTCGNASVPTIGYSPAAMDVVVTEVDRAGSRS